MYYIWEERMHKSLWQIQNSVRRYGVVQLPIPVRRPRHIGPITLASDTNANLPLGWRGLLSHLNVAETQSSENLHLACPPAPAGRASMPTSQEQSPDMSLSRPLEPASGSLQVTCWSRILRQWHKSAHRVVDGSRASPAMSADRAVALPAAAVTPVLPSPAVTPALPVPLSPRPRQPRYSSCCRHPGVPHHRVIYADRRIEVRRRCWSVSTAVQRQRPSRSSSRRARALARALLPSTAHTSTTPLAGWLM